VNDDDREVIEVPQGHELPEIFVTVEGENLPTAKAIEFIYIWRKNPGGTLTTLDWRPPSELPDARSIEATWGPGTYQLQGRAGDRRTVIRQIMIHVGDATRPAQVMSPMVQRAELDAVKLATTVAAIVGAIATAVQPLFERSDAARREEREQRDRDRELERVRMDRERERDESRNQTLLTMITNLTKSRQDDLEALLRGQIASKGSATTGSGEAYREGQTDMLQMIEVLREQSPDKETFEVEMVRLVQAMVTGKNQAREDMANGKGPGPAKEETSS
jgi:hypothetical protein